MSTQKPRVGYCLKVFPRFSQTFVLNEILAHQQAGDSVEIFSINRPDDPRFHELLCQVDSPIRYLDSPVHSAAEFWERCQRWAAAFPNFSTLVRDELNQPHNVIFSAAELAMQVQQLRVDHLHAHFGNIAASVARVAARLAGISYSFTAHARDIYRETVSHDDLAKKVRDAKFVVTVSQFNVDYLRETFAEHGEKIELVYNGLDLERFSYAKPVGRKPLILAIGRLVEKKGFQHLVEACSILRSKFREFQCEIIGSGPLERSLKMEIAERGLADCVRLVGPATSDEVKRRIQAASVVAVPCVVAADGDRDGLPTVILETMALGTPCVATDVTGIPEAIVHEQTGLIVPQGDTNELAHACARLLDDESARCRLSVVARSTIEDRFDGQINCRRLRELFSRSVSTDSCHEVLETVTP